MAREIARSFERTHDKFFFSLRAHHWFSNLSESALPNGRWGVSRYLSNSLKENSFSFKKDNQVRRWIQTNSTKLKQISKCRQCKCKQINYFQSFVVNRMKYLNDHMRVHLKLFIFIHGRAARKFPVHSFPKVFFEPWVVSQISERWKLLNDRKCAGDQKLKASELSAAQSMGERQKP